MVQTMKFKVAGTTEPFYKPRIWVEFVIDFRFLRTAVFAWFALNLVSFYEHVSIAARDHFGSLFLRQWMTFSPSPHIGSMALVASSSGFWFGVCFLADRHCETLSETD